MNIYHIRSGDYFIPSRIRSYQKKRGSLVNGVVCNGIISKNPTHIQFNTPVLSGNLWT